VAAGWFLVVVAAGLVARPGLPVLAGVPWLVVAGLYCTFCGWSYRDLVAARPGQVRSAAAR
jgi:amino acid transporter